MTYKQAAQILAQLRDASQEEQRRIILKMTPADLAALDSWFEVWAHKNQLPPDGDGWRIWLLQAGRGFGKTRAGAEWVHGLAMARKKARIALVGANIGDARSVMVEGPSGLLAVARARGCRLKWEPSTGKLSWPNGSEAKVFSGDNPDGLRGPEHDFAWFLTFEVLADSTPAEIGGILNDASLGAINCDDAGTVGGYAAYGRSIGSALEPLISTFRLNLFDDGSVLRSPANGAPAFVDKDALGNSADNEPTARIQREQASARDIPAALRLSYYDASRDYLTGEARAVASEAPGIEEQRDLPAVLDANAAKGLAQAVLAKAWARRDKLTLRLPPAWFGLEPGQTVELELTPRRWTVTKCTVDGLVVVAEVEPAVGAVAPVAADAGRALIPGDIVEGEVSIAMIDAAMLQDSPMAQPTVLLAATSPTPGWRAKAVEVTYGGQRIADQTSRRKAIMGTAATALAGTDGTVDVILTDPEQWLVSCDESALDEGANLALLGGELIQFTTADALGSGQFRLSGLVRGLRGTEVASHAAGDRFLLIEAQALKPIALPPWVAGYDVTAAIGERSATVRLPGKPEPAAIAEPSGGVTADAEAREAIAQMLAAMREQGLIAS